jgi:hypothetical protein
MWITNFYVTEFTHIASSHLLILYFSRIVEKQRKICKLEVSKNIICFRINFIKIIFLFLRDTGIDITFTQACFTM